MAFSSTPAYEGSTTHTYQTHNRSHRKVPTRLPLELTLNDHNDKSYVANGFRDQHGDDYRQDQTGFATPTTSRFPSQDISGASTHHRAPSKKIHNHSHSMNGHSHGHAAHHNHGSVIPSQPILDTPYQNTKLASILLSLLIALPFVLSSLVQVSPFELVESERDAANDGIRLRARIQARYLSFSGVCALTAATLVTIGFIGELQGTTRSKSPGKTQKVARERFLSLASLKKIIERVLSIGLPFYAASKLGGERVAVVILVALSAELPTQISSLRGNPAAAAWKLLKARKWTIGALVLQCLADLANLTTPSLPVQTISGYLALLISAFILPWPIPAKGISSSSGNTDDGSHRNSDTKSLDLFGLPLTQSPLISSPRDTELTVASGVLATIISFVVFFLSSPETQTLTLKVLVGGVIVTLASSVSLLLANSRALLPSNTSLSLILALGLSLFIQEVIDSHPLLPILFQSGLIMLSWIGVCLDVKWLQSHSHDHEKPPSWFSKQILHQVEDFPLLYRIFSKRDSRRIVYFMSMNFSFMFIQGVYGYLTGSLGLLSDTVHMFFDCAALGVGLVATLLSERQASLEYPYGFAKIDALAGFGNGVLLLAISFEFVYEAVERLASGSQLNRLTELLVVSTGGLLVNVFGLLAFGHHGHDHGHGHGHDHGHGDTHEHQHTHKHQSSHNHLHSHDHQHDHDQGNDIHKHNDDCHHEHHHINNQKENHTHNDSHTFDTSYLNGGLCDSPAQPSPPSRATPAVPATISPEAAVHSHNHHGHGHSHDGGSNMHGIYLHILADMMGSISVIVSTILVYYTGWGGWDALASVAISYFIIIATIPLVKSTASKLVLDIPEDNEFDLREALSGVGQLRGVVNITAPRFWLESSQTFGVMHIVAGRGADLDDVRGRAVAYLKSRNMDVLVQVEREGEGRCWCGSGTAATNTTNTTRAS